MPVNRNRTNKWKEDIEKSVDYYNNWFINFAPKAFRESRVKTTKDVARTLSITDNLRSIKPEVLINNPCILPTLRMTTCPPLARDRLIGLAGANKNLVERMEKNNRTPAKLDRAKLEAELKKICSILERLTDKDIFSWLDKGIHPSSTDVQRAASVIADRLCGATADPIIRNAQEARQLRAIGEWLDSRGYTYIPSGNGAKFNEMSPATYCFRLNIPTVSRNKGKTVNVPVDVVVMPKDSKRGDMPFLIEAKSAGDYTNVNKRRKEEAKKIDQLKKTYGTKIRYVLYLCGYFDSGYLGYEAAEGIDWIWEHRTDDFAKFGL